MTSKKGSDAGVWVRSSNMRFLNPIELRALKFAICESEGMTIQESEERVHLMNHFRARESNFMMYHTGEESIGVAWVLGDDKSFVNDYVHEEIHRILHKRIDLSSCDQYDNVSRYVEDVMIELFAFA
jgi:hypothetical protein